MNAARVPPCGRTSSSESGLSPEPLLNPRLLYSVGTRNRNEVAYGDSARVPNHFVSTRMGNGIATGRDGSRTRANGTRRGVYDFTARFPRREAIPRSSSSMYALPLDGGLEELTEDALDETSSPAVLCANCSFILEAPNPELGKVPAGPCEPPCSAMREEPPKDEYESTYSEEWPSSEERASSSEELSSSEDRESTEGEFETQAQDEVHRKAGGPSENVGWSIMAKFGFSGRLGANEDGIDQPLQAIERNVWTNVGLGAGDKRKRGAGKKAGKKADKKAGAKADKKKGAEPVEESVENYEAEMEQTNMQQKDKPADDRGIRLVFRNIWDAVAMAKTEEGVRNLFELSDLDLVGKFLYFRLILNVKRIGDVALMASHEQLRDQALDACKQLLVRCGGLNALLERKDYSTQFYNSCLSVFHFDCADLVVLKTEVEPKVISEPQVVSASVTLVDNRPVKMELLLVQIQFARAAIEEGVVSLWELSNLALVGKVLFFDMKFRVQNIKPMTLEEQLTLRAEAVAHCQTMASRCGCLDALLGRVDYCREFYNLCNIVFQFNGGDYSQMKTPGLNLGIGSGSSFESNPLRTEHIKVQLEFVQAARQEGVQSLWMLSNIFLVGKVLYFDMKLRVQNIREMKQTDEKELRAEAVTHCQSLARRCGSMQKLLARSDYCHQFFQLCNSVFFFQPDDMVQMPWA